VLSTQLELTGEPEDETRTILRFAGEKKRAQVERERELRKSSEVGSGWYSVFARYSLCASSCGKREGGERNGQTQRLALSAGSTEKTSVEKGEEYM